MALREEFEKQGNWLFRYRSYLPLLLVIIIFLGLINVKNIDNHKFNKLWEIFCLTVSFWGLGIRIITVGYTPKGTSGRNTKKQIADILNTRGIYSIVRHPLYLGNFFIWLGISLYIQIWWVSLLFVLIFWLYYERIMYAEEEFLRQKFGESYLLWSIETPAFLPKFKSWQPPELKFSYRKVLKKEYSGFYGIIASFTFLNLIRNAFINEKFLLDSMWLIIFAVGTLIYLILRIFKKKIKILHTKGR